MAYKTGKEGLPPGYDNLNFDAASESGPSAPGMKSTSEESLLEIEGEREILAAPTAPFLEISPTPKTLTYSPPELMYEDIYEACIQYVKESCCYGSRFVKEMVLTEIANGAAFLYILESFVEKRESALSVTPYFGQLIDGPENGPAPGPWDIPVVPLSLFQRGQAKLEIPHTAYVKQCDKCVGIGRVRCGSCSGMGGSSCFSCSGTGRRSDGSCFTCSGTGRRRCISCSGRGQVKCSRCSGHGRVKCCRMLIVTWSNHRIEFVSNTCNLPTKLVGKVTGNKMLYEEDERVMPIVNAPDESVNAASFRLIEAHQRSFPNERILRQRQILRAVPLTRVSYQWKNKQGEFYVYGQERKVFFQDYPQPCCCCTCL